jgi:hypothetical protein
MPKQNPKPKPKSDEPAANDNSSALAARKPK